MMIEKVLDIEKTQMYDYITDYAFDGYGSHSNRVSIDTILKPWETAKSEYLYKLLGEKFIVSKEISYEKGVDELTDEISCKLLGWRTEYETFVNAFRALTSYEGPYRHNWNLSSLMDSDTLATNIYRGETFNLPIEGKNPIQINKGCKVSKVLGKIAKALNLEGYEEFRIAHSQILNQKALKGKMCISIHPLDYMTMSHNDCGWTSCMNWAEEGEYRRGTVEMMNSPMVVVAYLASETPMMVSGREWSNKKWRQLFVVNKDIITGVKAYPYANPELEKIVATWLRDLAKDNLNWEYAPEYIEYDQCGSIHPEGCGEDGIKIQFHTDDMYNDFGTITHHAYINLNDIPADYHCNYSGHAVCMCCSKVHAYYDGEYCLVCEDCEEVHHCCECGSRFHQDELFELDNEYYCEYCYDNVCFTCEICDNAHHQDNEIVLNLARKAENGTVEIIKGTSLSICWDCVHEFRDGRITGLLSKQGTVHEYEYHWRNYYYVLAENCTDKFLDMFGFNSLEDVKAYDPYEVIRVEEKN